jgi:flagellin-like protein
VGSNVKKMLKSKEGISPILATLLLIVIAVAAVIVTYAWVMTFTSSTTSQAGVFLSADAVSWPTNNTITLYIRNTGTGDGVIDAIYVGTSASNLERQPDVAYSPSNGLVEAEGGTVTITITYSWTSQVTYYFKIAPKVGHAIEFNERAP